MSMTLKSLLDAARQLPPEQQGELATKLSAGDSRLPLSDEDVQRNREIVRRTRGTIKGLDHETVISLAEDEEY